MPLTIPPFVAYQAPLVPIASRWRTKPPEGDKFIAVEIDWGVTVPAGLAVQFSLNAGPVEFSQIVAFSVDNGRNGGDVSFIFPDTGRQLTVPAYAQGVYPVFTNALTFYAVSEAGVPGDVTEFEILNGLPPPVSVLPSREQTRSGVSGISLITNATTAIVPAGISGTLQAFSISGSGISATGSATVELQDGTGQNLWTTFIVAPNATLNVSQSGLALRFVNGLSFVVIGSTLTAGSAVVNVYYSVP
jgi:hypothetical protein